MTRQLSAKAWIGGTAFVAVLLLVAAWFLAVEPVVARASEDTMATEQQRDQNDLLEMEIARLAEQFTHLAEYQAELEALRVELPSTTQVEGVSRELQSLAEAAGVTIVTLAPSVPQAFVAAQAAPAVEAAPADDTASDDTAEGGAVSDSATTSAASTGLYTIPLSLTTVGSYDASVTFLRSIQEASSRLYLVSSVTATSQEATGASGGRPATNTGDLELLVNGATFVLPTSQAAADAVVEGGDESVPVPGAEVNPFQPGR